MSKPNDSPKGIVISVSGPVVDVLYPQGASIPDIRNAVRVNVQNERVIMEVVAHVGGGKVRCISLSRLTGFPAVLRLKIRVSR